MVGKIWETVGINEGIIAKLNPEFPPKIPKKSGFSGIIGTWYGNTGFWDKLRRTKKVEQLEGIWLRNTARGP